jgi:hypothetical protein
MTMPMANAKKKTFAEKADKRRAKDVKASTTSSSPIGSLKTLPYCVSYSVATLNAKLQMTPFQNIESQEAQFNCGIQNTHLNL